MRRVTTSTPLNPTSDSGVDLSAGSYESTRDVYALEEVVEMLGLPEKETQELRDHVKWLREREAKKQLK